MVRVPRSESIEIDLTSVYEDVGNLESTFGGLRKIKLSQSTVKVYPLEMVTKLDTNYNRFSFFTRSKVN